MNNIKELYDQWLQNTTADDDLAAELNAIAGNDEEIQERFYRELEFGTAGLRGVLGAGTNRMNIYTVGKATQGLADYLNKTHKNPSVAIAYDSRIKSDLFARHAAKVLAANGIKVYLFDFLVPTPVLSYAVRHFATDSGIIITASHNPAKYNGYKCYNPNGFQMTDSEAAAVYECIQKVDCFKTVKTIELCDAVESGMVEMIGQATVDLFLNEVEKQQLNKNACHEAELEVIYTPLNGAGNKPVREILKRIGVKKLHVVASQEKPDGNFPTCPYPNPEIRQVFEEAFKMTSSINADLIIATDPDCDRVGVAVKNKQNGEYVLMNGNEIGVTLLNYVLSQRAQNGTLPTKPLTVKTIVSTNLVFSIAAKYSCEVRELLTGFKYIGELVTQLEAKGEADRFVFGFEESYGYLAGTHARDKDAVVAAMLLCEMAAHYKKQGKTLLDAMEEIYAEHGYYINKVSNFEFEGMSGMKKMQEIMTKLRENPPAQFANSSVVKISDYKQSVTTTLPAGASEKIMLPKSNVLSYTVANGNCVIIRPSGTEPKIKAYITSIGKNAQIAADEADKMLIDVERIMGE